MEKPSPQTVGLQFVRQYYTVLNQAPEHLHRFYNTESSFVHGGINCPGKPATPVYGQQEIHKKILQLNFVDCHAKIRLVDSQATLGDGVVVQVTGELSNNGEPMRRFMQTFVLALQSPKKYYVHNDILRYQDEVFPDEEENDVQEGGVAETEGEDEQGQICDPPNNVQEPSLSHYYNQRSINNGTAHVEEPSIQAPVSSVTSSSTSPHNSLPPVTTPPISTQTIPLATTPTPQHPPSPVTVQQTEPDVKSDVTPESEKQDYSSQGEDDYQEKSPNKTPEPTDEQLLEPAQDEPKTYATMLSKNATGGTFGTSPNSVNNTSSMMGTPKPMHSMSNTQSSLRSDMKNDAPFLPPQPQRPPRPKGNHMRSGMGNYVPRDRMMNRGMQDDLGDNDRRRSTSQYPDSQQLFVGNLPHDVDEVALRELFLTFGHVVDMRINNKSMPKPGGPGRVPNFGFVVFDDPASVQNVLSGKPIFLGDHRLNVEEKKKRDQRMNSGDMRPGRPNLGRGGPMMGGRGGNRGMGMNRGEGRGGRGGYNQNNRR